MSNIIVTGNRNKSVSIDAVSKIMKGERGDPGSDGAPGRDGTDASVTAQNIQNALGYVPAKSTEVTAVDSKVTAVSNKVVVGGASDITSGTELFVDSSSDGFVEVPTMDELNEVKSKLEDEYVLSELVGAGIITPVSSTGGALFTSSSGKVYVV